MTERSEEKPSLDPAALRADLRSLRSNHGMTAASIRKCATLIAALGTENVGAIERYIIDRLDSASPAASSLAAAYRNAIGLGPSKAAKVTRRRADFGVQIGRHPQSLESDENDFIEILASEIEDGLALARADHFEALIVVDRVATHAFRGHAVYRGPQKLVDPGERFINDSTAPSVPLLVVEAGASIPEDLWLSVYFYGEAPRSIWWGSATTFVDLAFGKNRQPIQLSTALRDMSHAFGAKELRDREFKGAAAWYVKEPLAGCLYYINWEF